MSIKLEDLIHAVCSGCDWQINVPDGLGKKTVYQGNIDAMPLDVYFSVKDMHVEWCGEWDRTGTGKQRMFEVHLTYDADSKSMIAERYKQRMEWAERQKEYQQEKLGE